MTITSCNKNTGNQTDDVKPPSNSPYIYILGIAQDGGHPHAGCEKKCCADIWEGKQGHFTTSFALIDPENKKYWLFEASPDIKYQLNMLKNHLGEGYKKVPNGIFLTHAHVGHYSGLIHFGKEVMQSKSVPVYAMSKMSNFLKTNAPWSQLVDLQNIKIRALREGFPIKLAKNISVEPIVVPHRDEFSETVAFDIKIASNRVVFLSDIDKWEHWSQSIKELVKDVDFALLDGTFYDSGELNGRDMSEVPHPFVVESMELFSDLKAEDKSKIHFIHLNHTNPLLNKKSEQYKNLIKEGYKVAKLGVLN